MPRVAVIGLPSSAGSYAAGQDRAPQALRAAGLLGALAGRGLEVHDAGDLPTQVWQADREHPRAQNVPDVVSGLQGLAAALPELLDSSDRVLVLGGNCTVVLAVMAALRGRSAEPPGLLYLDRQYDLNTPLSTTDGALDWMGLAHAFALPGCVSELVTAFGDSPLLTPAQVAIVGVEDALATEWERQQAQRLGLSVTPSHALAADPPAAIETALSGLPEGPLAIHLDVDVLDFTDAPLAENTDGRNSGPSLSALTQGLARAARDPRATVLSVGELNPTRSAGDPDVLTRFVSALADVLSISPGQPISR